MNKLQEMIEEDMKFTMLESHLKLIQCPSLRTKYTGLLMQAQKAVDDKELDLSSLYSTKWRYYSMDYNQDLDRRDLPVYINGDSEYVTMKRELQKLQRRVNQVDQALKTLSELNWQIPPAIKFYMFQHGA